MAEVEPSRLAGAVYRRIAGGGDSWPRTIAAMLAVGVLAVISVPAVLLVSLAPLFAIAAARHVFPLTHHRNMPPYSSLAVAVSILAYGAIGVAVAVWSARRRRREPPVGVHQEGEATEPA